jgi:acetoacetyl-CoA synthetase
MNDNDDRRPLWQPDEQQIERSQMWQFLQYVNRTRQTDFSDYHALHAWSIAEPAACWEALWRYCGIHATKPYDTPLAHPERMPGARWFVGSQLNFAQHLLSRQDDHPALIYHTEQGFCRQLSYEQLYRQVASLAATFRQWGIQPGDRVAGFLPNMPETVIAMLASASLGAVWSACSPDFGIDGALDRLQQVEPKILIAADKQCYQGKTHDLLPKVQAIASQMPSLEQVLIVSTNPDARAALPDIAHARHFTDAMTPTDVCEFTPLPFEHPLYIVFSSGTTGKPKCIVHSAGGVLLQHLKELRLHTDLSAEDVIFYYTTCGWMMWNWLVSSLAVGATVVLYDGAPLSPQPTRLLDLIDDTGITVFGASAKYISSLARLSLTPRQTHRLTRLRAILSTGSPLTPHYFDYVYQSIKSDVMLCSISGGTDILSCFALGNPMLPVFRGELQCLGLGMAVDVVDEQGRSLRNACGELVCRQPFPSIPLGFWRDTDDRQFIQTYFAKYPGLWAHGDYAKITRRQGLIIYGRADATLNPGGVRIGTAEIYRQLDKIDDIVEGLAVEQYWQDDSRIVLFVVLQPGIQLDAALKTRISQTIRQHATPRHVPRKIIQVLDLPRTVNGKLAEITVRNIVNKLPVSNQMALANPQVLTQFTDLGELQTD